MAMILGWYKHRIGTKRREAALDVSWQSSAAGKILALTARSGDRDDETRETLCIQMSYTTARSLIRDLERYMEMYPEASR